MYRYLRKFGFGEKTGIDLPGESVGILAKLPKWGSRTLPTVAIGQEISVTPLQLVTATAAIANGGNLMKPFIVQRIHSARGDNILEREPEIRRRLVRDQTARTLTDLLENCLLYTSPSPRD